MLRAPVRAGPVLAATVNATVPLPVPLAPLVIVIHVAVDEDEDVHAHPATLVTVTGVAAPPAAGEVWLVELMVERQAPD